MFVGDLLKQHARRKPDQEAIVFKDRRITYREYDSESERIAQGLLELKACRGDRVGIYMSSCPEFLFIYLACAKIGAVAVPVSWRFTPQEIRFVIEDAGISHLFMSAGFEGMDFVENLRQVHPELKGLTHVIMKDSGAASQALLPYETVLRQPTPALETAHAALSADDPVLFLYTSGTTGKPKAAMLSHHNLISYARGMLASSGTVEGDTVLLNVPLNHVGGAVMAVMACLSLGNKLVLMDAFEPEETLKVIAEEKVRVMGQVPAQYILELMHPAVADYDLSSIRIPIVSGSPCPSELIDRIEQHLGILPINAYGLTEASGAITFTHPQQGIAVLKTTVGQPMEEVDLAILDGDGQRLEAGEVGEIAVKGGPVMRGYWNRPDETARVFDASGYLHTGDMGKLDEHGNLVIVSRKKEMYIRGGENVYPPEVEAAILQHTGVMMAAVIGRPDPVMGEVGRAYIIPSPGAHLTAEELQDFLKTRLARFKIPTDVILVDKLPLTPLGKVRKLDLYNLVAEEFDTEEPGAGPTK